MNTYTVTHVADNARDWNSQRDGAMKSYRVTLRNERGQEKENVELSRKMGEPAPAVGEAVQGTVDTTGSHGPKLVVPRRSGGGGGWRPKPPEERRSIAMQHAQKCAVSILELADQRPAGANGLLGETKAIATALFDQVIAAEKGST